MKRSDLPHEMWPMQCYEHYHKPGYKQALNQRLTRTSRQISSLYASLTHISAWKTIVTNHIEHIISRLHAYKATVVTDFDRLMEIAKGDIDAAAEELQDHLYNSDYTGSNAIVRTLWQSDTEEMKLFTCLTPLEDWRKLADELVFTMNVSLQSNIQGYTPDATDFQPNDKVKQQSFYIYQALSADAIERIQLVIEKFNAYSNSGDLKPVVKRGPVNFPDGVYLGEWNSENQRHGAGQFLSNTGEVYEGQWKQGKIHGYGRKIHPQISSYLGNWSDGKKEGYGKFEDFRAGEVYIGTYAADNRHGLGSLFSTSNQDWMCYMGQYTNGKFEGYGTFIWKDFRMYTGQWRNGGKHGKGLFAWTGEEMYLGDWAENERNGYGRNCWSDGSVYRGQWRGNRRCD